MHTYLVGGACHNQIQWRIGELQNRDHHTLLGTVIHNVLI